jgi:peptidoglycan/LPS O-acetylase OafA/YrhL
MSDNILILLVCLGFPVYLLIACHNSQKHKFLSAKQTGAMKGMAILFVYIHHYGQIRYGLYNDHSFLGFLGVALFLFISGYVTHRQMILKENNWNEHFWQKKIMRLFVPRCIVAYIFGILAGRSFTENSIEALWFVQDWFFTAIVFNFAVFYIAKKMRRNPVCIVLVAELLFVIVSITMGQLIMWYNTAFMFGIGAAFSKYEKRLINWAQNYQMKIMVAGTVLFTICLAGSVMRWQSFTFDTLSGFLFVLLMILSANKYCFYSRELEFAGKYSWEFYLVHTRVIGIVLNRISENDLLAFFISFVVSMLIAMVLNEFLTAAYRLMDRQIHMTAR